MKEPITSKVQMVEMFGRGCFGNHLRQWDNVTELVLAEEDDLDCKVMLRFRKPDGPVQKDLDPYLAIMATHKLVGSGEWTYDDIYFNEVLEAQDEITLVQGEMMRTHLGLYLMCNFTPMRMREAMRHKDVQHVFGIRAREILRHHCDTASYENIMALLDEDYPDHIIELTVCSKAVGSLAHLGHNTIVWEVRDY